jgi:mannose-1-phosphate guanylyltransferase
MPISQMSSAPEAERRLSPAADGNLWVVVPAGGAGTRLQAFIRHALQSERPKQFCRILGSRSMLRHTWDRALQLVPAERIVTVVTAGQERYLADERRRGIPGTLLVQPENRETGPGLLLPLLWIARQDPRATVAVFPADHFIWEEVRFVGYVRRALEAASLLDRLILLGVEADGPETGYGWIRPAGPIAAGPFAEFHGVEGFVEKPDPATAARVYAEGCLWNTFVLAGHLRTFLRLAETGMPEVLEALAPVVEDLHPRATPSALGPAYRAMPSVNFSKAVLARHPEDLLTLAARNVYWSDWGDPERILHTLSLFDRRPHWLPRYAEQGAEPSLAIAS